MSKFYDLLLAKSLGGGGGGDDPGGGGSTDWDDPTDGKTHVFINFPDGTPTNRRYFEFKFDSGSNYPLIEWGDGDTEQITASGVVTHAYAKNGTYDIALSASGQYNFANVSFNSNAYVKRRVIGAWLDSTYGKPNNFRLTSDNTRAKRLHVCSNMGSGDYLIFGSGLEVLEFEEGISKISGGNIYQLYNLTKLTIPSTVSNMTGTNSFGKMDGISEYHFLPTSPPSISSGAFSSIQADCVIYVPKSSVSAYKSASNWSSVASYIVGE